LVSESLQDVRKLFEFFPVFLELANLQAECLPVDFAKVPKCSECPEC